MTKRAAQPTWLVSLKIAHAEREMIRDNLTRCLYVACDGHVVYVPAGWADDFDHETGGPSFVDEDAGEPSPELYGYGYVGEGCTETGYDTLFWKVADLLKGRRVSEAEARTLDPGLFAYLDSINRGDA